LLQQYRSEISSLRAKLEAGNDMLAQQQKASENIMQAEKRKVGNWRDYFTAIVARLTITFFSMKIRCAIWTLFERLSKNGNARFAKFECIAIWQS
jgi:hypothetical protein